GLKAHESYMGAGLWELFACFSQSSHRHLKFRGICPAHKEKSPPASPAAHGRFCIQRSGPHLLFFGLPGRISLGTWEGGHSENSCSLVPISRYSIMSV